MPELVGAFYFNYPEAQASCRFFGRQQDTLRGNFDRLRFLHAFVL